MISPNDFLHSNGKWNSLPQGLRGIIPYKLAPDPSDGNVPFTVPAAGAGPLLVKFKCVNNFQTVYGTPVEITDLIFADTAGTAASDISVMLKTFNGRDYMNAPVHIRTLFGFTNATGHLPSKVREPFFLRSSEYVMGEFRKLTGGATTIYPYMLGVQYYPISGTNAKPGDLLVIKKLEKWRERSRACYPFWLTTDTPIVHSGSDTVQSTVKIADCNMELFTAMCVATAGVVTPNFNLEIKEVVTGQTLMNGTITQTNGLGNSQLPTIFPFSYLLPRGAVLRFTTTELSGNPTTIYLTFQGRKIFAPLKQFDASMIETGEDDIGAAADYERNMVKEPVGAME